MVAVLVYTQCGLNMFSKAHTYVFDCAAEAYVRGGGVPKTQAGNFTALPVFVGVLFWPVDHV